MIIVAKIVKLQSDDGLIGFLQDKLGKTYHVETLSRRTVPLINIELGVHHEKELIDTVPFEGWLPIELLELGNAPGELHPWEKTDSVPAEDSKADY